jgi:hypothetical protein
MRIPQTPERIKEAPAQALRVFFASVGQVLLVTERIRRKATGQEHSHPVSAGGFDAHEAPAAARGNGAPAATVQADQGRLATTATPEPASASVDQVETDTAAASSAPRSTAKTSTAKAGTAKASTAKSAPTKTATAKADSAKAEQPAKASSAKTSVAKTGTAEASSANATATTKPGSTKESASPAETIAPAEPEAATPAPTGTPADSTPPEVRTAGVLPVPHYSELSVASLRARLRGLDVAQVRDLLSYERSHEDRANVIAMFERRIAKLEEGEGTGPAAG